MYGLEALLLDTRCSILKTAGFKSCTTVGPRSLASALKSETFPYDLLILCHTVPIAERQPIAALAAQHRMPVFQIDSMITPVSLIAETAAAIN